MAEKYLKSNGNDVDATIGDLLAVGVIADDGSLEHTCMNGSRTSKQQAGKPFPGGNHLFGGSGGSNSFSTTPSNIGPPGTPGANLGHKDLYPQQQQLIPNSLSTLAQPLPSGVGSQTQQMQALQMQQHMQMPSATVLGYQQMLSQQLSQLKIAKQQVTQQLRQVSGIPGQGSAQQQIQTRLNLINQFISHINQQLMLQKYSSQQKDKPGMLDGGSSVTPGAVGSQPIGRNNPTSRNKDMKLSGPIPSRSMSLPGGAHEHNLALGMQGLNINGHVTPSSISQSSARSVSRLQQIISGSSSDTPQHIPEDKTKFRFPPVQSASTPAEMYSSTSSPLASSGSSTTTTTPASTPFSPARSFTDIQEFRPGVPWQPRTLPTEPAQLYAKPVPPQHPELRTAQSEPSFAYYNLPLGSSGMRPYRRPPSLGYNSSVGNMAPGSFRGRDQHQGWPSSSIGRGSTSSPMTNSPFGTPDRAFPPNTATFGGRARQQNQMKFDGTEELGPPLTRPNALFPNQNTSQAPGRPSSLSSSTSSDTGRWGSSQSFSNSRSSSSSSVHPPSSLTSSVWESSSAGGNPSWNLDSLETDGQSYTTPASGTVPSFTSPPNTSSDEVTSRLGGTWDKRGFHPSTVLSPEPSFEEWQAGKKAHLSVFKLPSNPPAPWLCIQNVSSQVGNYNTCNGSPQPCVCSFNFWTHFKLVLPALCNSWVQRLLLH